LLAITGAAGGYVYPRFQPVSIAFFDQQHGLFAENDWPHGLRLYVPPGDHYART
jgi:hypothetical protein